MCCWLIFKSCSNLIIQFSTPNAFVRINSGSQKLNKLNEHFDSRKHGVTGGDLASINDNCVWWLTRRKNFIIHAVQYLTRPVSFFLKSSSRCKTWSIFASSSADRKLKSKRSRNSVLGFMSGCCSFHLLLALVRQFPQTFSPLQRSSPIRRLCVHCEHKTQQSCQTESKEPCTHTEWATGWSCFCFVFSPASYFDIPITTLNWTRQVERCETSHATARNSRLTSPSSFFCSQI